MASLSPVFGPFDYFRQLEGSQVHGFEIFNPLLWDHCCYELFLEMNYDSYHIHERDEPLPNYYGVSEEMDVAIAATIAESLAMTGALDSELVPR